MLWYSFTPLMERQTFFNIIVVVTGWAVGLTNGSFSHIIIRKNKDEKTHTKCDTERMDRDIKGTRKFLDSGALDFQSRGTHTRKLSIGGLGATTHAFSNKRASRLSSLRHRPVSTGLCMYNDFHRPEHANNDDNGR